MKPVIVAFDFDGTITRKDTLLEFIRFSKGSVRLWGTFLFFAPLLIAYKLGFYPNWKVKEKIFTFLYRGMTKVNFNTCCKSFFEAKGRSLIRKDAFEKIRALKEQGCRMVIVSASIENWVKPFAEYLGIDQVIGTVVEFDRNSRLTGRFLTANCYGEEKVNRLLKLFPDRSTYELHAYGDSRGDKELLDLADCSYYKWFKA